MCRRVKFESNNFELALKIVKNGLKKTQHYSLDCVRAQILIKKARTKIALKKLENALTKDPNNVYLLRTKHIIQLSDDECWYGCAEKPLDVIDNAISLMPNNRSVCKATTTKENINKP